MSHQHHEDELCDIKSMTGDYPGIIGFNLADLDTNGLDMISELGKRAYARGNLIAFHMEMSNPVTGGPNLIKQDSGEVLHTVRRILPGGDKHQKLLSILDALAAFVHTFKDDQGHYIPVIFRPFHENNAKWFWYGQNNAAQNTPDDYTKLWRFTVEYLRDTKQVHNFLYVYAPSDQYLDFHKDGAATAYLKTFPGDAYVDVMAFDGYHNVFTDALVPTYVHHVHELVVEAERRGKIPAIAEIGLQHNGIEKNHSFWMNRVLSPIKASPVTRRLAYIMTWTNRCAQACSIWLPYKGHPSEADFLQFYHDNITVFSREMPDLYT
ncbi:mannan endo-1,4-beta-mannosidase-like [Liolophura sinensis]|uniref:mannan endo-1,4-beta-mannosidase-like n=1 Tax=Liolophura sinensis TaxID=3198878 RepID=UPI003158E8E2